MCSCGCTNSTSNLGIKLIIGTLLLMVGCLSILQGPPQTLDEVEFEGAKFGLEYIPDPTLEGYRERYYVFYQPKGAPSRKYLLKDEDGFQLGTYPVHESILGGLPVIIVDTVQRAIGGYGPTETSTTLYMDPKAFSRKDFDTFVTFVKKSYEKPDTTNTFLLWMNKATNVEDDPDTLYFFNSLYAIVYSSLGPLEPVYEDKEGKGQLRIGVDDYVYFRDLRESTPLWGAAGHLKDSVFYYWIGQEKNIPSFREYSKSGKKFGEWFKRTEVEP